MKRQPSSVPLAFSNLAFSSANLSSRYVCLRCRHRASLRRQALLPILGQTPSLTRTYADKPGTIDRFQEGVTEFLKKRMFKEDPTPPPPTESKPPPGQQPGDSDVDQRLPAPTRPLDNDPDYKPATSGEGLEMIGGLTGWWEKAWDEQYQFKGFMPSTPVHDGAAVRKAIERALVEVLTLKDKKPGYPSVYDPISTMENMESLGQFDLWENEKGGLRLEWERDEDKTEFLRRLNEIKRSQYPNAQKASEVDMAVTEEDTGLEQMTSQAAFDELAPRGGVLATGQHGQQDAEPAEAITASQGAALETTTPGEESVEEDETKNPVSIRKIYVGSEPKKARQFTGLRGNIDLTNPRLKFVVIKRVMQLTGTRIPDPVIQSIDSTDALHGHLIKQPQPKKLAQVLVEGRQQVARTKKNMVSRQELPLLSSLPNVKIYPSKLVPQMAEGKLGRQKVIEMELDRYGIPVPFRDVVERIRESEEERLRRNSSFDHYDKQEVDVNGLEEPDVKIH
ncbi:MAG: hypothetical protein Q9218_003946 [Villophora microphyllina]